MAVHLKWVEFYAKSSSKKKGKSQKQQLKLNAYLDRLCHQKTSCKNCSQGWR